MSFVKLVLEGGGTKGMQYDVAYAIKDLSENGGLTGYELLLLYLYSETGSVTEMYVKYFSELKGVSGFSHSTVRTAFNRAVRKIEKHLGHVYDPPTFVRQHCSFCTEEEEEKLLKYFGRVYGRYGAAM